MAAETPFGLSFGDPRKYMGQSPLAQIGKGLKEGLTAYALKESGFTDYLNKLGKKEPQGSIAPIAPASPVAVQPPQAAPTAFQPSIPAQPGVVVTPIPDSNVPPADIGEQVLDGTWTGFPSAPATPAAPISVRNPTDFNPFVPDTGNQVALTGNEYQQIPGFGSAQDKAGKLMKIMGMG